MGQVHVYVVNGCSQKVHRCIFVVQINLTKRNKARSLFFILHHVLYTEYVQFIFMCSGYGCTQIYVTSDFRWNRKNTCIFLYDSGIYFMNNCVMAATILLYIVIHTVKYFSLKIPQVI